MSGSAETAILTGGAAQASGSLVGPVVDAGKGIYKYLKRNINHVRKIGDNYRKLKDEADFLYSRQQDVEQQISSNQVMMEMNHECRAWLSNVEIFREKLKDWETRYQNAKKGSSKPIQLHTFLKLSKEIVSMTDTVVELRDKRYPGNNILRELPRKRVERKPPKKVNLSTQAKQVKILLELLKDDSIKKVGVLGWPGVGKTTILEIMNEEVQKLQIFEDVLWVNVLKEWTTCQIRQEILKQLGCNMEENIVENHAATYISRSLENKKYLLLLDEVSSAIKLHDIGINESQMQGKVVVATRDKIICNSLDLDEQIEVERLSSEDAWKLFRDAIGELVEHPRFRPIAKKVLRQCGELPHVIRVVGKYLKEAQKEDIWRDTLSSLQSPSRCPLKDLEEVFVAFKLIYENLQDTLKACLLFGASFPDDHEIYEDHLFECWKAEQLIGIRQPWRKACEEGLSNLTNLVETCIFDRCKSTKYVKMPIIFRRAALRMAYSQNFGLLVIDGDELESHPSVEKWSDAKVVSLMNSDLEELPENPTCPRVSTLFLQKNIKLCAIPTSFFQNMPNLKTLDLYGTGIKFLPPSISELNNLHGLYLNDCQQLVDLPAEIGKLQNLKVLDIRRTGLRDFPVVIKDLIGLQCLRVSFTCNSGNQNHVACNGVDISPSRIFEELLELEELAIDADPKDSRWAKIVPKIVQQLKILEMLNALSFYFPTTKSLEAFTQTSLAWKKRTQNKDGSNFRLFNIYVGCLGTHYSPKFDISNCFAPRYLQYCDGKDTPSVIKEVLVNTYAFALIGHQNITNFSDFDINKMETLEVCEVKECNAMTTVVSSIVEGTRAFPWLRELHLLKLQNLNRICEGPISSDSFARLKTLIVYDCPNLLKVISWRMAKQLKELQNLRVEKCPNVMEVIELDTQSGGTATFLKLQGLELISLEGLVNIHVGDSIEWPTLQQVEIFQCENLTILPFNRVNATKLHCIKCSKTWWDTLMLTDEIRAHLTAVCCFTEHN